MFRYLIALFSLTAITVAVAQAPSYGPIDIRNIASSAIMQSGSSVSQTTNFLKINKGTGSPTAVTLPSNPINGIFYTIKDGKGDCKTNPITLTPPSGLIDGNPTFVMNINSMAVTLVFDGTNWNII
jgi:hypothetical protein